MQKQEYLKLLNELAKFEPPKGAIDALRKILKTAVLLHAPYERVKVKCLETGEVFDNAKDAALKLGCSKGAISSHLNGRFPSIRGIHLKKIGV
jgi:hypothetical protein